MRKRTSESDDRRGGLVGLCSLIALPLLLIAYQALHHGLDVLVGARAVAALYFLGFAPGYLVQRYVFRVRAATPFETMLSSLLLGMLVAPALWYTLCLLGLAAVFAPLMIGLGLGLLVARVWRRSAGGALLSPRALVRPSEAPLLWVALALALLWSYRTMPVERYDGQVFIAAGHDHALHTALVAEMARGVPPQTVPFMAGAKTFGYHHMPDVWCDMMRRAAGTDPVGAYFGIALVFRYLFVSFGCYLALVGRFGRVAAIAGAACVLGAVGHPTSYSMLTNGLMVHLPNSLPNSFGVIGAFLTVYYISAPSPQGPRGPLLLASFVSVLLFWFKVNFALVVAPAVAVVALVVLGRRREYRWLLLCWAIQGLLVGVRCLELSDADFGYRLVMRPLAFVGHQWEQLSQCRWDDTSTYLSAPTQVLAAVWGTVDGLPAFLRWPAIFLLFLVKQFHVGMAILAYAVLGCGFARRRLGANRVDLMVSLVLLFAAVAFIVFPIHDVAGLEWAVAISLFALVHALMFALLGPVLCDVIRRLKHSRKLAATGGVALLVMVFAGNAYGLALRSLYHQHTRASGISEDLYACYGYVEASTPQNAMVLQPRLCKGNHIAGMLMQRRVVIEDGACWRNFYNAEQILADAGQLYAGTKPSSASRILNRYSVDYVVAEPRLDFPATPYDSLLTEVFRSGDAAVYRVKRIDGPSSDS